MNDGQFDLARAKEGGLDAMFFSLFVTEQYYPARLETKQVLRLIDAAYAQLEKNKGTIQLAFTASDVERIAATGKIAAFMPVVAIARTSVSGVPALNVSTVCARQAIPSSCSFF